MAPANTQSYPQEEDIDRSFTCYKAVKEAKADTKNNLQVVASVYDSMNNLCSALERLDSLMEEIIFIKDKEKSSPQAETFD
jgi:ABC-type uncharacterized transport system fused permease/ATPase subunit